MNLSLWHHRGRGGFTLVEVMLVCGIMALMAAIAVPAWIRARKRSQATMIWNDLKQIDAAVDQYALETSKEAGHPVGVEDWRRFLKANSRLQATATDLFGNPFGPQTVDQLPKVPNGAFAALSDMVSTDFWSPYAIADP